MSWKPRIRRYNLAKNYALLGHHLDWIPEMVTRDWEKDSWSILRPLFDAYGPGKDRYLTHDMRGAAKDYLGVIAFWSARRIIDLDRYSYFGANDQEWEKLWIMLKLIYDDDPEFNLSGWQWYCAHERAKLVWAKSHTGEMEESWFNKWLIENKEYFHIDPYYSPTPEELYLAYGIRGIYNFEWDIEPFLLNGSALYFEYGIPEHKHPLLSGEEVTGAWLYWDQYRIEFLIDDAEELD